LFPDTNFFYKTIPRYDFLFAANNCRIFRQTFSAIGFFNFYVILSLPLKKPKAEMDTILSLSEVRENPTIE
jgi:hypothetical protein